MVNMDSGISNVQSVVVSANSDALVTGPCRILMISQNASTGGTDTTYEVFDALTGAGTAILFSRTLSISLCQPIGLPGVKCSTGISVKKTGAGDSKFTIVWTR